MKRRTGLAGRQRPGSRLKSINRLNEALLGPASLGEKLDMVTQAVVEVFGADFARIWIVQPGDRCHSGCIHANAPEEIHRCMNYERCLHLTASSGRYTHLDGEHHRRVPLGCYKIGRLGAGDVMGSKFLSNDVTRDPHVHDQEWAAELGLVSFAGYQLRSKTGDPLGVLGLFSKSAISPQDDVLLAGLANTSAQVIQTAMAEEALRQSEARYRLIAETALDAIVTIDQDSTIVFANSSTEQIFG